MSPRDVAAWIAELEQCFTDALAVALPNPVALIFSDLPLAYQGKRDLVFALGLLNEGENEAALIAGLIRDRLVEAPGATVAHLEREAWYYLRTSIDAAWQVDDGSPSMPALLAYLTQVVTERTAAVRKHPLVLPADSATAAERTMLLRRLRDGGYVPRKASRFAANTPA